MKIVFFGTPDYVIDVLDCLHKAFKGKDSLSPICAVVTQSPKPIGRKNILTFSPVDNWAHKHKVPIFFSAKDIITNNLVADIGILASFGEIIPKEVIKHFPLGILNIHPSLLPKYRGSSPLQAAILSEDTTGVSIIKLDEELDHGPIVTQFKEEIRFQDTAETLRNRLFKRSVEVLVDLIPAYAKGKIKLKPQDDKKAVFTRRITKQDGFIPPEYLTAIFKGQLFRGKWKIDFIKNCSLSPDPHTLNRFIRAMQPWPITWTYIRLNSRLKTKDLKRLKILKAHFKKTQNELSLDLVQLEGKNPVSWKQFCEAYPKNSLLRI
jgi:methionyl-tRNA formyltransferase